MRPSLVKPTEMVFVDVLVFLRVMNLVTCGNTISLMEPRATVEDVT